MYNHHSIIQYIYVWLMDCIQYIWTGGLVVMLHCIQCCMEHSSYLIYILTNRWRPPLKKILTLILQHQPHFHTLTWWRTVVHHLCLYMEDWSMSVQV